MLPVIPADSGGRRSRGLRTGRGAVSRLGASGRQSLDGAGAERNPSAVRNLVNLGVVGIVSQDVDS